VLDYRRARLEIAARAAETRSRAELDAARLAMYRTLVEKSAGEPASKAQYRELFLADALHLAVEQGVKPADRTHGRLYGTQGGGNAAGDPDGGWSPMSHIRWPSALWGEAVAAGGAAQANDPRKGVDDDAACGERRGRWHVGRGQEPRWTTLTRPVRTSHLRTGKTTPSRPKNMVPLAACRTSNSPHATWPKCLI